MAGEAKDGGKGERDLRSITVVANEGSNTKAEVGAPGDGGADWCVGAFTCAGQHPTSQRR